ncbi:MAG: acyl carrier protein [Selenomonadaceae bacterium]|nr:acyl carrier protein [Selenomonadaceae bacterium]MBR1579275.1 acyl carrier protein [Selenomonadaceae bacterium]
MTNEQILSEMQSIFRDVFDDDSLELTRETNANSIEDWDSLSHIRLIAALEKHFNLKFNFRELQDLNEVGDMIDLIAKKLNG